MASVSTADQAATTAGRARRKWTRDEDTVLEAAVTKALEEDSTILWHEIAASIPGRTNKDCRKRWYRYAGTSVKKGSWTEDEDGRLYRAVMEHGTKWSVVANEVGSRTGDQCSKRWNHTVNPDIDHSEWKTNEDENLLEGVKNYGRNWQKIVSTYFPTRTSLAAKNRYNLLCRRADGARPYNKAKLSYTGPRGSLMDRSVSLTDSEDELSDSSTSNNQHGVAPASNRGDSLLWAPEHGTKAGESSTPFEPIDHHSMDNDAMEDVLDAYGHDRALSGGDLSVNYSNLDPNLLPGTHNDLFIPPDFSTDFEFEAGATHSSTKNGQLYAPTTNQPPIKDAKASEQDTRCITIQAVCSADKLGTVVQAVMGLSLSAVFKTTDLPGDGKRNQNELHQA